MKTRLFLLFFASFFIQRLALSEIYFVDPAKRFFIIAKNLKTEYEAYRSILVCPTENKVEIFCGKVLRITGNRSYIEIPEEFREEIWDTANYIVRLPEEELEISEKSIDDATATENLNPKAAAPVPVIAKPIKIKSPKAMTNALPPENSSTESKLVEKKIKTINTAIPLFNLTKTQISFTDEFLADVKTIKSLEETLDEGSDSSVDMDVFQKLSSKSLLKRTFSTSVVIE